MAVESKKSKVTPREKRKLRLRKRLVGTDAKPRICIFKSDKHTYAQLISDESRKTFVSASTLEDELMAQVAALSAEQIKDRSRSSKGVVAARTVGLALGARAKEKGFVKVVFDRNGFMYHGRVKAVAEGARQAGLQF
jgi:large subunit ribosomal protein L18